MKKRVLSAVLALSLGASLLAAEQRQREMQVMHLLRRRRESPKPLREKRRQRVVEKP